ncbi:MAG: hypothetical protein OHK0044_05960 [Burkholderiaceae bacterium]
MRSENDASITVAVWSIAATLALVSCGGAEAPAATAAQPPQAPSATPDTIAPSAPTGISATATSAVSIRVTWSAATDNVGVTGYRIFRDGSQIGTSATTTYDDLSLAPSTTYRYEVAAFDGAGNVSPRSTSASASTQAASGRVISAGPADYLAKLRTLQPGDTLLLAPGTYDNPNDVPGLPIFNLNGTPSQPITITGPDSGPRPLFIGRSTHNTIRFANASHVIVRNLEVDGRDLGGFGVAVQGLAHHITIEGLRIRGVGGDQQIVGISTTGSPTWNWVIRRNVIEGAGTGMYLGSSTGGSPFVAGVIENNLIVDTIGYNVQVKHQTPWSNVPPGMPTGRTTTVIRNNVFVKRSSFVSADGARPNLLVGDQPSSGPGSENGFQIYGNFFYQNPTEALFQGEGNIAFYGNVMVNDAGSAVNIQPHNGVVRNVRVFGNTIVASGSGIRVSGGAGYTQHVIANAVFAATPISGGTQTANATGAYASASNFLNNPTGALGQLDLFPRAGALRGTAPDTAPIGGFTAWDRDFNGNPRDWSFRGAYSGEGANPGWLPKLEIKP